jgi:hypothetical protein
MRCDLSRWRESLNEISRTTVVAIECFQKINLPRSAVYVFHMEKTEGNKLTIDRVIPENLFCQSPPTPGHLFSSIVQLNDMSSEDFSKGFPAIGQSLHPSSLPRCPVLRYISGLYGDIARTSIISDVEIHIELLSVLCFGYSTCTL